MAFEKDLEILMNLDKFFMLKEVDLVALKDIDPSQLNIEIGYKKRGTKFRAPLYIARKLVEDKYATIPEEYISWLKKTLWKEKKRTTKDFLAKHEDSFYERLSIISQALRYDPTLNIDQEYRKYLLHTIGQMLTERIGIIFKKMVAHEESDIMDYMAPEESLLLRLVSSLLNMWTEKLGVELAKPKK